MALADAGYPKGKRAAHRVHELDLLPKSNALRFNHKRLGFAVASQHPLRTVALHLSKFIRVRGPVAPEGCLSRIALESFRIDPVLIIQGKSQEVRSADRAGRKLPGAAKFQADRFPVHAIGVG